MTRLILALALLPSVAWAHSWYPWECCSNQDCVPIKCEELVETRDGFEYDGVTFSKTMEKPSKDRNCHVCISAARKGLCVFTMQGT